MRIRTREKALRAAASVVLGRSAGVAAVALALLGCPDASSGPVHGGGDGSVAGGDVSGKDVAELLDMVLADSGGPGADTAATGDGGGVTDVPRTPDTGTTDVAPPDTGGTDAAAKDTGGDTDAAPGPGEDAATADTGGAKDAEAKDTGATDTTATVDAAGGDAKGVDAEGADSADAAAGPDIGCMQPTGIACTDVCEGPPYRECVEGECYETNLTPNADAEACCQEKYAAGVFDAPGCTPWGPPAPPPFDRAAARAALRGLA